MQSLLDRESSNFIKGVLITFVIIGHNVFITSLNDKIWVLVNLFNVSNFFIIVFTYGCRENVSIYEYIKKISFKILPYYIATFFTYAVLYKLYSLSSEFESLTLELKDYIFAFFLGGGRLKDTTGFLLLWFFPSFYYFLILKYFVMNRRCYILLGLSFFIFIYQYVRYGYFCYLDSNAITSSFYFLPFAIVTNLILRKFNSNILFMISLLLYLAMFVGILLIDLEYLYFLVPMLVFIILFRISKIYTLLKSSIGVFFIFIGKNSMFMYISHSLFFYLIYFLYFKNCNISVYAKAIITFVCVVVISSMFAVCFNMINKVIHNISIAFFNRWDCNNNLK